MAASYLFVHGDVKADAIYVDIEQDITLDNAGESTHNMLDNTSYVNKFLIQQ